MLARQCQQQAGPAPEVQRGGDLVLPDHQGLVQSDLAPGDGHGARPAQARWLTCCETDETAKSGALCRTYMLPSEQNNQDLLHNWRICRLIAVSSSWTSSIKIGRGFSYSH